jgi:hypothetical protein
MTTTIVTHLVAFLAGAGGGIYVHKLYAAKVAADLVTLSKKI